jgi:hypothetical protein
MLWWRIQGKEAWKGPILAARGGWVGPVQEKRLALLLYSCDRSCEGCAVLLV